MAGQDFRPARRALHELEQAEAAAARQRELQNWVAKISEPKWGERDDRPLNESTRRFVDAITGHDSPADISEAGFNPNQPRDDHGRWSAGGGGGATSVGTDPNDHSRWYLPSDDKGTWVKGTKGEGTFRLKKPIDVNGKLVSEIEFTKGVPILDGLTLPGKSPTIILTGDHNTDIDNAKAAWRRLNPGKKLPSDATFHHDLLHVTEHTVEINGKKTKVLIGKMHLIPTEANKAVFHQGSASVAKKYYHSLAADAEMVKSLAKKEASLAGRAGTEVAMASRKIKPGKIAKGLLPFVGRNVARAIPLVGTGLAVLEFADNVKAHGVGGAVARATPVLGDLIAAHDVGSALADDVKKNASDEVERTIARINAPVEEAQRLANEQTVKAYNELAPQIRVTNPAYEGEQQVTLTTSRTLCEHIAMK